MKLLATALLLTSVSTMAKVKSLPVNYKSLDAESKRGEIWERVENSRYSVLPKPSIKISDVFSAISSAFVESTFTLNSDEMRFDVDFRTLNIKRRKKIIHETGAVAKIKFVPSRDLGYQGIFAEESIGVARISTAVPQTFNPGIAIKFLQGKGKNSLNLIAMKSLSENVETCNPFALDLTNSIPKAEGFTKLLAVGFNKVAKKRNGTPNHLTLKHLAKGGKAPFKVLLKPSTYAKSLGFSCDENNDYRNVMRKLSSGERLYSVFAYKTANSFPQKIGEIVLESSFVASEYGDKVLFFQHKIEHN